MKTTETVEKAQKFAQEKLRPFAAKFDEEDILPLTVIAELGKDGYLGLSIAEEYGGQGLDSLTAGLVSEQLGKACCPVQTLLTVHHSITAQTLQRWGTWEQKEYWLPKLATGKKIAAFALSEPDAGSNAKGITTQYARTGDRFILNGRKTWISFGAVADVFLLVATGNGKISAFLVERERKGIEVVPISGMMAGKATYLADISLNEVEIPVENLLGLEGHGFDYIVNTALDNGRYSIAWSGVAIAGEALDAMVSYAGSRHQFGKQIGEFQLVQKMIADGITETAAAKSLCIHAGRLRGQKDPEAIVTTAMAKYYAAEVAVRVTSNAVQVHGANGFSNKYPVGRLFREAKVLQVIEGTSEILQQFISTYGSGIYFKKNYPY